MSSMRNAVQRRPYRERAQPLERRHLGLLEKHKDYALRAKDYNKKQAQLKALRQKAADRNEDEFYFGMMSRKGPKTRLDGGKNWNGTVQGDHGNKVLDMQTVRLLKTQDMGYTRTMRRIVSKEVSRLEEQMVLTRRLDHLHTEQEEENSDDSVQDGLDKRLAIRQQPRKIVFADNEDDRAEAIQDAMAVDGDDGDTGVVRNEEEEIDQATSIRRLKRQLEDARKKLKALATAEGELDVQRAKMAKTATSGGRTRKGHKIIVRTRKR